MRIYKIIKQTSINDRTKEKKERYVLIQNYTTFIERLFLILGIESKNPVYEVTLGGARYQGNNIFNTIEKAREAKEELEKIPDTYTHKNEEVK